MKHARQAKDPVCGMMVDIDKNAIRTTVEGTEYYFCAATCRNDFIANPAKYLGATVKAAPEPAHTKWAGIVAPKFGSAGSGGAEYEPGPPKAGKRAL